MRTLIRSIALSAALTAFAALPLMAQEGEATNTNLLAPNTGLMFWTLVVFAGFVFIMYKAFWPLMNDSVDQRIKSLKDALDSAKRDREESARLLAEHKAQLEGARNEAQKIIADGRAVAEKMRGQVLEDTKKQQDELLARAKRDIEGEKTKAIGELRKEAIDLALLGASKVIEKNLDDATNRKLVDDFLSSVGKR
ncbi:MAG TPA: F0F1 ATP synthase subunit B [Gemmatimonadaceae bacterium]|nr:F0F1 ATP synthase subunit B [Gemmatimonadaceae bacterium]